MAQPVVVSPMTSDLWNAQGGRVRRRPRRAPPCRCTPLKYRYNGATAALHYITVRVQHMADGGPRGADESLNISGITNLWSTCS